MRIRDFGVVLGHLPTGPNNTLTDVPGVRVGHATLISGETIRTGVTAIWPHQRHPLLEPVYAGMDALNGFGELTCRSVIEEVGLLAGPIMLTGTGSVGSVMAATTRYLAERHPVEAREMVPLPVVGECDDGFLHDHLTFAVDEEAARTALESASEAPVPEGCVGGGTGMALFGFKGGIGSASRIVASEAGTWTVAVLVMTNFGTRQNLTVGGVSVGAVITDLLPERPISEGSCIGIVATDAPLTPNSLRRVAKRVGLGLARTGSTAADGSGEIFLAFSTAHHLAGGAPSELRHLDVLPEGGYGHGAISAIFTATVEAAEEAVLNALVAATTTQGRSGHTLHAIPHDRLRAALAGAR